MTKGITPVVAVILLLLIVISVTGFVMVMFQRTTQQAAAGAEEQLNAQIQQSDQQLRIEAASGASVTLRNRGSEAIAASSVAFFVNGGFVTCAGLSDMAPSAVAACTLSQSCDPGDALRVSSPGTGDSIIC